MDDLVFLVSDPSASSLQKTINSLINCCEKWNMRINLKKREEWWHRGDKIEVVNEYKYLEVNLTLSLSWISHLRQKLVVAKQSINSVWSHLISNYYFTYPAKLKAFN